jgi:hypothetical protein
LPQCRSRKGTCSPRTNYDNLFYHDIIVRLPASKTY